MPKIFHTLTLCAAGGLLLGNAVAQQTTTAKPATTGSAASKSATASKPHTAAKPPLALTTQKGKLSYALGMNIGAGLKGQSVEVDPEIVARGIKDMMSGSKPLLTEAQVNDVLKQAQTEVHAKQQAEMQKAGAANKQAGDAFLAANKGKDGVVTLPSGLQYKILTAGTGPKPLPTDSVVCNYKGTLVNGTEFDSSYKRGKPVTFPVNGVIKGWQEALPLMPVGSKWQLFVPADLAYGDHTMSPELGPNSTLIFEVELLSIEKKSEPAAAPATPSTSPDTKANPSTPTTPPPDNGNK